MNQVKRTNLFMLFIFMLNIIGSFVYSFLVINQIIPNTFYYSILFSQVLLVLVPVLIYLRLLKLPLKAFLRFNPITLFEFFAVAGFSLFILPLISFINALTSFFVKNHVTTMLNELIQLPVFISLTLIALLPAINEEILSRGILYHTYKKTSVMKGALLSSLFFGMIHMNINQFLYAFILGFIFVLLVEATDSIYAPILAHFMINGINIVMSYSALSSSQEELAQAAQMTVSIETQVAALVMVFVLTLITTPIAFIIYYSLAKHNNRVDIIKSIFRKQAPTKEKLMTWHVYVCLLLFIGYSLLIEFS